MLLLCDPTDKDGGRLTQQSLTLEASSLLAF